ncbi:MAG: glucose-6-phosphate isomerase [Deltaproteobacteria bacterium]|jgi:glucose-6-phosphate isomerase|nr:glucose-6-phosphate isomerase [Deltaproteobacteria bacterium]
MTASKSVSSSLLKVNYNNLTQEAAGPNGLDGEDLKSLKEPVSAALKDVLARHKKGNLPFIDLALDQDMIKQCRRLGDKVRKQFQDVVVLGIGGSALGSSAVYTALSPLNQKHRPQAKGQPPRLTVADNIDPDGFAAILETVDLEKTYFNVISKSGATAETMSQFLIVYEKLRRHLGRQQLKDHLLVTTDPANGVLRKMVQSEDLTSLPIPPAVGGRFSVFTPVGLAPLAMAGVSIQALMEGVLLAREESLRPWQANKAAMLAGLNWFMATRKNRPILVLMPYAESLALTADWFGQLWNESLGKAKKLDGSPASGGQTAVKAVGVTDQHSQLQMYMEGPQDKTVMFLGTEKFRKKVSIPGLFAEHEELGYLAGGNLGQLLEYELRGTERALAESGRPNLTLTVPEVTPQAMGFLLHTLEMAAVVSGSLYGVDPLDQPGVELGKKFTYGLMGRPGFEDFLERYQKGLASDRKYILL